MHFLSPGAGIRRRRPFSSNVRPRWRQCSGSAVASSLRLRSQIVGGRVRSHRRSSSPSTQFGSAASRRARPAFFVSAPQGQFVAAPLTDGSTRLAGAVQAAREGGSVSVTNVGESEGACAA